MSARKVLVTVVALIAGMVIYYAFAAVIVFLVFNVLHWSISTADLRGIFLFAICKIVPLIAAMLTVLFIVAVFGENKPK